MAETWTDIADASIAAGKPLKTGLMIDFRDNDEANSQKQPPLYIDLSKSVSVTSYPASADFTLHLFIPADAKFLRVRAALWQSGAVTASAQLKVGSGAASVTAEQSSTASAKGSVGGAADKTWTLTDLSNAGGTDLRGTETTLEVRFKVSSGSVTIDLENTNWPPSRFSRR